MAAMSDVPAKPSLPRGLPATWVMDRDVHCPTCGYNLRMLREPRCPECGLVFRWQDLLLVPCPRCNENLTAIDGGECPHCQLHLDWQQLLAGAGQYDRRLYEFTEHPLRAALRTWLAALNPWHFWSKIPLAIVPAVLRLRWLRRWAVAICAVGLALLAWLSWPHLQAIRARGDVLLPAVLVGIPPLTTTLVLPLFWQTMTRFRIRRDQLLRCLAYSTSGLAWLGLVFIVAFSFARLTTVLRPAPGPGPRIGMTAGEVWCEPMIVGDALLGFRLCPSRWCDPIQHWFNLGIAAAILLVGFIWWWVFLYVSLRRYLQLNRRNAAALLVSTQAIALLTILLILLQVSRTVIDMAGHWSMHFEAVWNLRFGG